MNQINFDTKSLTLVLTEGGLNSLYSDGKNKISLYESLLLSIIQYNYYNEQNNTLDQNKYLENLSINELIRSYQSKSNKNSFIKSFEEVTEIYFNFVSFLNEKFIGNESPLKDLKVSSSNMQLTNNDMICKYDKFNLILFHNNLVDLITDYIILKSFGLAEKLIFVYENPEWTECSSFNRYLMDSPKSFVFYSHNLNTLYKYKKLGTWTVYLTYYVVTTQHKIHKQKLNNTKLSIFDLLCLKNNLNDFENINNINIKNEVYLIKNGRFFNLSCNSFNNYLFTLLVFIKLKII